MPFMHHLDELRKRLTVVVVVLLFLMVGLYFVSTPIYRFLVAPVSDIPGLDNPISIRVFDPMMVRFKVSIWAAVIVGSPLIIWQAMAFFLPALKERERKWVVPTFFVMVALFLAGAAFCYTEVLHNSFLWLAGQAEGLMELRATAQDLATTVGYFLIGFGIAFQTPVIVFYLVYFGVVPYKTLRENWRVVWVVIVVVAAMATPDWSPITMGFLAAAMIVLYELSMLLVRIVLRRKIRAQAEALEAI